MSSWLDWLPDEPWVRTLMALVMLLGVAWLFHLIAKRYIVRMLGAAMKRLPNWWAQTAVDNKVLYRLVPLVPVIIIGRGIALVPHVSPGLVELVQRLAQSLVVLLVALAIGAALNVVNIIYNRYPIASGRPIKGYLQAAKLVIYIVAGILVVSALMAESPWVFLTGLGAMMAVILLIFRDTLLSLVAGIQLVNNDLVRVGDWIEMPQFNADGDVIDISLNVVQVRNWDKTITAIPTHKFLDHSFKNWRGMFDQGGRRISRPVHIDMTTIRFLTEDEVKRFSRFRLLREYIAGKVKELDEYNREYCAEEDAEIIANARHLTNIGTFRAYIYEYLKNHPMVHPEYTTMVRQLEPGPHGLPLQVWTFVKDTRWVVYEGVQSDIFDHILSIAPEFGLRVFQEPTGYDLVSLRRRSGGNDSASRAVSPTAG
ncbi:MAG: mechanosensitive ion channel family protein [Phycisphaerales bacterium]|nr:MAG: mechanosensitive ion channel family protein [Phycisphaerales bacterium]